MATVCTQAELDKWLKTIEDLNKAIQSYTEIRDSMIDKIPLIKSLVNG